MKLTPIESNMTVLDLGEKEPYHYYKVLFSYETPVAYSVQGPNGLETYKTSKYYSKTTSKHINSWFHEYDGEVDQEELDNLVK